MHRTYRISAALLLAAFTSGCGASAMAPAGAAAPAAQVRAASALQLVNVDKLIADYKALGAFDAASIAKRIDLIYDLGGTDDDRALAFLQAEFEGLDRYPQAVRDALEPELLASIEDLDSYDEDEDEAIIASGAGITTAQATNYAEAMTRRRRHTGVIHWLTSPFRWVGNGLRGAWDRLRGKKKRRKRRRPRPNPGYPGGDYGGSYPNYPSQPNDRYR